MTTIPEIKKSWSEIHQAIHSGQHEVIVHGVVLPVRIAFNGCRFVKYDDMDLGPVSIIE